MAEVEKNDGVLSDEQARKIYPYHNGKATIFADPTVIYRKLMRALVGDMSAAFELAKPVTTNGKELPGDLLRRLDGEETLTAAARIAFGLAPFDPSTGEGVTDGQALGVLYAWSDFLSKNGELAAS